MEATPSRIGPYDVLRELGRGAMGIVYHARHAELGREVALKVIAAQADRSDLLARFQREARAAAQLAGHPGIVGVTDLGADTLPDGRPVAWFAMELVRGESLDAVIESGELDVRTAVRLVAQAARAAHYAHEHGIIHRDLKPANILIETGDGRLATGEGGDAGRQSPVAGRARITDFGLVSLQDVHGDLTRITTSDLLVGTPAYMAPEQVLGTGQSGLSHGLSPRVDVWSLGATLYECLVGHPPFRGESIYSVLSKLLHEEPPPIRPLDPGVPAEVESIVMHALQKDPAARYPSAAALADDCEAWLDGRPVHARPPTAVTRLGLTARRHRGAALVAGGAAAAAGLAIVLWWLFAESRASRSGALQATTDAAREGDRAHRAAQAWRELSQRTLSAMQRLEDHWNVAPSTPQRVAADLAAVRAAAAEVQARYPEAKAPAAWLATAEAYAARASDFGPLRALVEAAGDDPFPALLLARLNLAVWSSRYEMPAVHYRQFDLHIVPAIETPSQASRRELAAALLSRLAQGRAFLRGADVDGELELLRAASLLSPGRPEAVGEAAAIARGLLDDPALSGIAARLYGLARFVDGDAAGAADAWAGLAARRGWVEMVAQVAHLRLVAATQLRQQRDLDGARALFARVRDDLTAALATEPDTAGTLVRRAHAWWGLAQITGESADPGAEYAAGRADLVRAVALAPHDDDAWRDLLHLETLAAWSDPAWGRDPAERVRWALQQAERWLARDLSPSARGIALAARGSAGVALGGHLLRQGEPLDAVLAQTLADLTEAQALHPRDPALLNALADAHALAADRAMTRGESPREPLAQSLALYREAARVEADPEPGHRHGLARSLSLYGGFCTRWGEDPAAYFAEAVALATGLEAELPIPEMPELTGTVWVRQAETEAEAGRDPTAACRDALVAFARARALRRGARSEVALHRQANALWLRGRWEQSQGVDPTASLAAAAQAYTDALAMGGADLAPRADRALVHLALGEWADATGADPLPHYEEALADQDAVVAARPNIAGALHSRGVIGRALAAAQFARGLDATEALGRARDDLNLAVKLDDTSPSIHNDRGLLFRTWAETKIAAAEPPRIELQLALHDFDRALELAPDHQAALNNRGNTYASIAKDLDLRERDPREAVRLGIADFDRLLALAPDEVGAWNNRALLHQQAGDAETHWGDGDADPHYALAVADFDAALQRNPQSAAAYANRGVVHLSRGEGAQATGRDPLPHFQAAIRDQSASLEIAPGEPGALINRAVARRYIAMARLAAGEAAEAVAAERAAALQDLAQAIAANPRLWQAHSVRGLVLADLGRRDEALAAYDAALDLHPGQRSVLRWRQALEQAGR